MVNISLSLSMDGGVLETSSVDNRQTQPWNSSVLMQLLPMLWWCQRRNLHTPQRNGNRNRHGRTFEVCAKYQLFSAQPYHKNLFEKTLIKTPPWHGADCQKLHLLNLISTQISTRFWNHHCTISLMLITLPGSNGSLLKIGLGPKGNYSSLPTINMLVSRRVLEFSKYLYCQVAFETSARLCPFCPLRLMACMSNNTQSKTLHRNLLVMVHPSSYTNAW